MIMGLLGVAVDRSHNVAGQRADASAEIVGRMRLGTDRYATVQFVTAAGVATTAQIPVVHQHNYTVGRSVMVRYEKAAPQTAWERDMAPSAVDPLGALAMVAAFGVFIALIPVLRRQQIEAMSVGLNRDVVSEHGERSRGQEDLRQGEGSLPRFA
jgi:hypothetical protein